MRYLMRISYDGSKFYGFQRLNHRKTIQGSLEEALSFLARKKIQVKGAGRTDRGVHAKGQVVHFDFPKLIPAEGLRKVLNKMVAPYLFIWECKEVAENFHARFSVVKKIYRYRIYLGAYNPIFYDYAYICPHSLNLVSMKKASNLLLGVHNFQNFVSGKRDNYMAILYDISFQQDGDFLDLIFVGKSFYRYMVRNLVGALLDIGRGKRTIEDLQNSLLEFPYDKRFSTAISNGLYLEEISYENGE